MLTFAGVSECDFEEETKTQTTEYHKKIRKSLETKLNCRNLIRDINAIVTILSRLDEKVN